MGIFQNAITSNPDVKHWYNFLQEAEKQSLHPIFEQVSKTAEVYNTFFNGFELYLTGSTLNLTDRNYNDIDLMVVIPSEKIEKLRLEILKILLNNFKAGDLDSILKWQNDPRMEMLDFNEILPNLVESIEYSTAIKNSNSNYLLQHLGSQNEVNKIIMDPEPAIEAIKMRVEGMIEEEKNKSISETDGTAGYLLGSMVEGFLKDIVAGLELATQNGSPLFQVKWHKSFSEGYGKIAGENNCYIYAKGQTKPVHLFLTTGLDNKKAMEKKESFMLEYYSDQERMKPIRIY